MTRGALAEVAAIVVAIVALDQTTKWLVTQAMDLHQSVPIVDGLFNLTYVRNAGAAFGLFGGLPETIRGPLFIVVSLGALGVLARLLAGLGPGERALRVAVARTRVGRRALAGRGSHKPFL